MKRLENVRGRLVALVVVVLSAVLVAITSANGHVAMSWPLAMVDLGIGVMLAGSALIVLHIRGRLDARIALDAATVGIGAALAAWVVIVTPAIERGEATGLAIVSAGFAPLAALFVLFVLDTLFDGLTRNRAARCAALAAGSSLLVAGVRALLMGEVIESTATTDFVVLAMSLATAGLLAATLLQPDFGQLLVANDSGGTPVQAWTDRRQVAPVVVGLAVPIVVVASVAPASPADVAVRIVMSVMLVAASAGRLLLAVDSTAAAHRVLARRLTRDELTNLLTRSRFVAKVAELLDETWRSERRVTLIQVNVDRFKNINDTLGHEAANRLLVALADRLSTAANSFGGTVARAGGDDFVIVDASTCSTDDAESRIACMRAVFLRPFTIGDKTVFVTASIGVAMAPRTRTVGAEELMRRADIATHRAKLDGRNRAVMFDDSMQSNLTHRMDVEHALHGAIGRQEMQLYYQPIVDIMTGQLSGFEALIRWKRSDGSMMPPAEFIPIAEETGIINEIGAWALDEALRELRRWIEAGTVPPTTTVSVNVSPRQVADPYFADIVRAALERSALSPHLLWLEMTESMMLDEPELAESTLRQIRATGVRLALDDFGTGYSSLSLLQQFPIQRIKIDRAFVQGIADHSNDRSLVRTIIAMAQSMGLDLVAEGVETVHQMQSLRDLGCDKAQGYLISRPVPADAMHTTMVALVELVELSLFSDDQSRPGIDVPDRWLETASSGTLVPLGRQLATRPLG